MSFQVGFNENNYISQYSGYMKDSPEANAPRTFGADNLKEPAVPDIMDDKLMKKIGVIECTTCQNRRYVDGSNDPGVSFKTPTQVSPESSSAAVAAHEQEHVSKAISRARTEGRRIVSQSVQIYKAICPECGRVYTSGGKTTTTTKSDSTDYFKDNMKKFFQNHYGRYVDTKV